VRGGSGRIEMLLGILSALARHASRLDQAAGWREHRASLCGDLVEMELHGLGVADRQYAYGTEQIS
jgi:hypothetical protein